MTSRTRSLLGPLESTVLRSTTRTSSAVIRSNKQMHESVFYSVPLLEEHSDIRKGARKEGEKYDKTKL